MTLETVKNRLQTHMSVYARNTQQKKGPPLFNVDLIFELPSITVQPNMDSLQSGLNKAVQMIIDMTNHFTLWNYSEQIPEGDKVCSF